MKEFIGVNLSKNENVEDSEDTSQTVNWIRDIYTNGILHWDTEDSKEVMMKLA